MVKKISAVAASLLLLFAVVGYFAWKEKDGSLPEEQTKAYSVKEQMDIAMKNAKDPQTLATVNGEAITQTDMDIYSIDSNKRSVQDLVRYYIITDYAEMVGLELEVWDKELLDGIDDNDGVDEGLDEEYCQKVYGISKEKVTEYRRKRIYQIGMNYSFSKMIIDDVSSGEFVERHPELEKAYERFEEKRHTGSNAWDYLEDAYYELIKENYDIKIY